MRELQPAPLQSVPDGSTISGTLTTDDTWELGVITVTGDIIITPTVTIVITPGTTVQMTTTNALSSGVDPARIEWIISGTLQANGPVTFTSQGSPPAGANWYGLRFVGGGQGTLVSTTIQYGVFGIELDNNGPMQIEGSTIRYMTDVYSPWGGTAAGVIGGWNGLPASTILISNTQVYSITGQHGLAKSATGGMPDSGGWAYGIALWWWVPPFTPPHPGQHGLLHHRWPGRRHGRGIGRNGWRRRWRFRH